MKKYLVESGKRFTLWWGPYLVDIVVVATTPRKVTWRFLGVNAKMAAVRPYVGINGEVDQESFKGTFLAFLRRNKAKKYKEPKKNQKRKRVEK